MLANGSRCPHSTEMTLPLVSLKLMGMVGPYDTVGDVTTGGGVGVGVVGMGVDVVVTLRMIACKHVPLDRSPMLDGVSVSNTAVPACTIRFTSSGLSPAFSCNTSSQPTATQHSTHTYKQTQQQ